MCDCQVTVMEPSITLASPETLRKKRKKKGDTIEDGLG